MQIVIDIDEDIAQGIIDGENDAPRNIVRGFQATIADAIKNGTPLPKGKWTSATLGGYTCSNCNKEFTYPRFIGRALYYYCPNCGARMTKSEE